MRLGLANNAGSKLTKSITATATTIEVESTASFPPVPFPLTLARSEEIVTVTSVVGNVLTVQRAQQGTTAKAYIAGTDIWGNFTAGHYNLLADKEYVDTRLAGIPQPDLSGLATKQEMANVDGKIAEHELNVEKHIAGTERTKWNQAVTDIGLKTTLKTTDKTNLVNAVNELFTSVSNGKQAVGTAIADKGGIVPTDPTFPQLVTAIGGIEFQFKLEAGTGEAYIHPTSSFRTTSIVAVKALESSGLAYSGVIRVSFVLSANTNHPSAVAYGQIYKNGQPLGALRSNPTATTTTFTEDITVRKGDVIQLYTYSKSTGFESVIGAFKFSITPPKIVV